MELLFAALGGTILGFILHFALPAHETRGALWSAGWATCSAIVVWEALIWAGWKAGGGWIWAVALVAAGLTAFAATHLATKRRKASDAELLQALFRGAASAH